MTPQQSAWARLALGLGLMAGVVGVIYWILFGWLKPKQTLQPPWNIAAGGPPGSVALTWSDSNGYGDDTDITYKVTVTNVASGKVLVAQNVQYPTMTLDLSGYLNKVDPVNTEYNVSIQIVQDGGMNSSQPGTAQVNLAPPTFLPLVPLPNSTVKFTLALGGCGVNGPYLLVPGDLSNNKVPMWGCWFPQAFSATWRVRTAGLNTVNLVEVDSNQALCVDSNGVPALLNAESMTLPVTAAWQFVPNADGTLSLLNGKTQKFLKATQPNPPPWCSNGQCTPSGYFTCSSAAQDPGAKLDRFWMTYSSWN